VELSQGHEQTFTQENRAQDQITVKKEVQSVEVNHTGMDGMIIVDRILGK
jgi:hypothetical protein